MLPNNPVKKRQPHLTLTSEVSSINRWGPEIRDNKKPCSVKGEFKLIYPFFRTKLYPDSPSSFDRNNIPLQTNPVTKVQYYDPMHIISYGLEKLLQFVEEGEIPARYEAIHITDWLIENLVEWRKHIFAWPYPQDFPFYKIKKPWIAAKTHSLALSLLMRIAYIDNNATYEEIAKRIVRLFFLPVSEGGLVRQLETGGLAFEEYPLQSPALPLYGQLYSLIGLAEYIKFFEDNDVKTIMRGGLRGLKENLPKYDTGKWLLFDLHPSKRYASKTEINNNCILLIVLSELTGDDEFSSNAKKWYAYTESSVSKRHYFFKKIFEAIRLRFRAEKYGIEKKHLRSAPR